MEIPTELVSSVRELIARHQEKESAAAQSLMKPGFLLPMKVRSVIPA
jgi:hypothetical protein